MFFLFVSSIFEFGLFHIMHSTTLHAVWVFQSMACVYDIFMWYLPKARNGTPERVADAKLFIFHHVVVIFLNCIGLPGCIYTYYSCGIGVMEGTNFFVGIYRLSQHLGLSKRHPWVAVDVVFLWLACTATRIALPLYHFARLYLDCQIAPLMFWKNRPWLLIFCTCSGITGYAVLTVFNFMWYFYLCKLMYKTYTPVLCPRSTQLKET